MSLLPTRNPQGGSCITPEEYKASLRAKYEDEDLKLCKLEEEYDFLIRCYREIRAQQTELSRCGLEYPDSSLDEKTVEIRDEIIKQYMDLSVKNKNIRAEMAVLKDACVEARNECSYLFAKYRDYVGKDPANKKTLKNHMATGGNTFNKARSLKQLDDHGAMDMETSIEGALDMFCTCADAALLVGGLGATTAMTTLFSASRGRLDIMAWAYGCFTSVIVTCSAAKGIIPFRKRALADWVRSNYTRNRKILVLFVVGLVALPLSLGQMFLLFSVVLLDASAPSADPGSIPAIYISGYLVMIWLAITWIVGWNHLDGWAVFCPLQPPTPRSGHNTTGEKPAEKTSNPFPSHILPPQVKWEFMPGGPKFLVYRQWRRSHMGARSGQRSNNPPNCK